MNPSWIAGILSAIIVLSQLFYRSFFFRLMKRRTVFLLTIVGIMELALVYVSLRQYYTWSSHASGLLPPYTPLSYFIGYIATHLWLPYVISALLAFIWWAGMRFLNARHENRFFYEDEFVFAPLALFLVGYPGALLFIVLFLLLYVLWSLWHTVWHGEQERVSSHYLWIPLALCVILVQELYAAHLSWWGLLKI